MLIVWLIAGGLERLLWIRQETPTTWESMKQRMIRIPATAIISLRRWVLKSMHSLKSQVARLRSRLLESIRRKGETNWINMVDYADFVRAFYSWRPVELRPYIMTRLRLRKLILKDMIFASLQMLLSSHRHTDSE